MSTPDPDEGPSSCHVFSATGSWYPQTDSSGIAFAMQVDPSLLPDHEEPDLSGIDPALLRLSQAMTIAQEVRTPNTGEETSLEFEFLNDNEEQEDRSKSIDDVLTEFVGSV
jgi:hypothetical protein